MAFDVQAAKQEGYSDAEIAQHLAQQKKFNYEEAKKEGYTDTEILAHLSDGAPTQGDRTIGNVGGAAVGGIGGAALGRSLQSGIREEYPNLFRNAPATPAPQAGVPNVTVTGSPAAPKTGGENWVKSLTGADIPDAQMSKRDLDIAKGMRETVGRGGPLAGGSITESGVMVGPKTTAEMAKEVQAAKEAASKSSGFKGVKEAAKTANRNVGHMLHGMTNPWAIKTLGNALAGAGTGMQAADAYQRFTDPEQGWIRGAVSGLGALGSAATMTRIPGAMPIGMALGAGAPFLNEYLDEFAAKHPEIAKKLHLAEGGKVQHFAGGKRAVAEEVIKGVKSLFTPRETKILRASEALAPHEGKYLNVTQSDRMRSTGGDLGGPGFSRFQTIDPAYEGAAWGVGKKPTASAIVNYNKRFPKGQAIWSPMIGPETQHHSNQHVFDTLADEFNRNVRLGKLTPELRQRVNERLQKYGEYAGRFDPNFDIANPEMLAEAAKTFDRRGALAEVMSGKGVGGQKGSIIDYPAIMQEMTDPMTVGAPTHSIGTRLFNLTGEVEHRPDLHSAFPYILKGEDQAVAFNPIPKELALRDWMQNFRDFKGRSPGYYDMTRTIPSQQITEDYLRSLEAAGHAEGGKVQYMKEGKTAGGLSALAKKALKKYGVGLGLTAPFAAEAGQQMSRGDVAGGAASAMDLASGFLPPPAMAAYYGLGASEMGPRAMDEYPGRQGTDPLMGSGSVMEGYVPRMAKGGTAVKKILGDIIDQYAPKAAKQVEAGAPHSYPPKVPEGTQWMRDYEPTARPAPEITYMGKATSSPYYSSPTAQQDIMSAADAQRIKYLKRIADGSPGNTLEELMQQYPRWEYWMR